MGGGVRKSWCLMHRVTFAFNPCLLYKFIALLGACCCHTVVTESSCWLLHPPTSSGLGACLRHLLQHATPGPAVLSQHCKGAQQAIQQGCRGGLQVQQSHRGAPS